MLTKDQAQTIAAQLDGKHAKPNVIGKNNEIIEEARGKRRARVAAQKTNGTVGYVVNVTFPDRWAAPFTISTASDGAIPLP